MDGQCGAFTVLFENMLFANGIPFDRNNIEPISGVNGDGTGELILVRNWILSSSPAFPSSYYTHVNQIVGLKSEGNILAADMRVERNGSNPIYEFLGNPQVTKADGIPGQGVDNPYADFGNHLIIKSMELFMTLLTGKNTQV